MAVTYTAKGARQFQSLFNVIAFKATAIDITSLADGVGANEDITVPGAALGDLAEAAMSLSTAGITVTANVIAANTVRLRFQNESGGTLDLASQTVTGLIKSPKGVFNAL